MNSKMIAAVILLFMAALVVAIALSPFAPMRSDSRSVAALGLKGINVSYIDSAAGWNYAVLSSSNTSDFGPQLKARGYMDMYETEFAADYFNYSGTVPDTITLVVYRMKNSSLAAAAEANLLSSLNIDSNSSAYNYTFFNGSNHTVMIYRVYAVEAQNLTKNDIADIPIYQESTIFTEGSFVGSVTSNGGKLINRTVSAEIAEKLARAIASDAQSN